MSLRQALRMTCIACATLTMLAMTPHPPSFRFAVATLRVASGPYLPGSRLVLSPHTLGANYTALVDGPGRIVGGTYLAPDHWYADSARLLATDGHALATRRIELAPAPSPRAGLIAVASYDDGIAVHDPRSFALLGILATGGHVSDVAFAHDGSMLATDTDGVAATLVDRAPWRVARIGEVPLGDAAIYDARTSSFFVTNRAFAQLGGVTRISATGETTQLVTGDTPEAIVLDPRRDLLYVGNLNGPSIAVINPKTMRVIKRFAAVPRVFGLALSQSGRTLYAISNQSQDSPFAHTGEIAAFATATGRRIAVRPLHGLPLGVALDTRHKRLFVTDESLNRIDVLDARTLRSVHAPLSTCETPWQPSIDARTQRLYIPCARANRVDVFDLRSLTRMSGAPFRTAGYPLSVAFWRAHRV